MLNRIAQIAILYFLLFLTYKSLYFAVHTYSFTRQIDVLFPSTDDFTAEGSDSRGHRVRRGHCYDPRTLTIPFPRRRRHPELIRSAILQLDSFMQLCLGTEHSFVGALFTAVLQDAHVEGVADQRAVGELGGQPRD